MRDNCIIMINPDKEAVVEIETGDISFFEILNELTSVEQILWKYIQDEAERRYPDNPMEQLIWIEEMESKYVKKK